MIDLKRNLINSVSGIKVALRDKSFRFEIMLSFVLAPILLVSNKLEMHEKLNIVVAYIFVLIAELFNTSIEKLCDRVTSEYDIHIKSVKDISSAAVFLAIVLFIARCVEALLSCQK